MSEGRTRWHWAYVDYFVAASHLVLGLVAVFSVEILKLFPLSSRISIAALYLVVAGVVYFFLRQRLQGEETLEVEGWKRFQLLSSHMLGVIADFLKDRYKVNHELATKIEGQIAQQTLTPASLESALLEADKERRAQIKSALSKVSTFIPEDTYRAPQKADLAVQDQFKISFYAVEKDPDEPGQCLLRKWRYYPNEAWPRTKKFRKGEGAAGKAWDTGRVVVCESGGKDPVFKDMWEGGGQNANYASMICIPAIEDIPAERISEVYGVLTVDTPIRDGYYQRSLERFWPELFEPICNLLIHCHEAERVKTATVNAVRKLVPPAPATNDKVESTS
jgi:hypothetical protein